jgi:hypothetical protein
MVKLFLISLDLMVALPILGVAAVLLFSNIYSSQGSALHLAELQRGQLGAFEYSQTAAAAVDGSAANFTDAESIISGIAGNTGLAFGLYPPSNGACSFGSQVCRLVTVSGVPYLLVVSNESTG